MLISNKINSPTDSYNKIESRKTAQKLASRRYYASKVNNDIHVNKMRIYNLANRDKINARARERTRKNTRKRRAERVMIKVLTTRLAMEGKLGK